jgi:hypothetical protein
MSASLGEGRFPVSQLDLLKKKKKQFWSVLMITDPQILINHGIAIFYTLKYNNKLKLHCIKLNERSLNQI